MPPHKEPGVNAAKVREALDLPDPKAPPLPSVGLHHGVPFQTYLDWDILSQSVLKEGRETMAHARAAFVGERKKKATDSMVLGSALHTAFLEPDQADRAVVEWKGDARRGAAWDDFRAQHEGKAVLTSGAMSNLCGMVESLRRHPIVKEWKARMQQVEASAVGLIERVLFKGRADAVTAKGVADLKMVTSTNPRAVTNTVMDFGYHIQAAAYRRLFDRERYVLVCVESTPPHDVVTYELDPAYLRLGEEELASLLQRWRFCCERGEWPGRSDAVEILEAPAWALPDVDFGDE